MGLFSRKKVEVVEEDLDPEYQYGPRRLRIIKVLRGRYAPQSIECNNVSEGDVHDESAFNVVVVTDDFMSSPKISLPYQKRIQMVIETVADEFGTPLPFTLTVQAALTLKEYDGEATVPAQPGQFAIGTIK